MPAHLNDVQRARLVTKIESGIAVSIVAAEFGVTRLTAHRIYTKWQQHGTLARNAGSGRPKVSNDEQDQALLQVLLDDPFENAVTARVASNFPGSSRTARRRIKSISNLENRAAARKPLLTQRHKDCRVNFALQFWQEEPDFWNRVVFSDEKTFQSCYNGRMRVYRPPDTRFDEKYTQKIKRKFSVNVWGWISSHGVGLICRLDGMLNGIMYRNLLENVMLPSVAGVFPDGDFIFQQDNCPAHTAHIVQNWMGENNINLLPWPAMSSDLNPIENLWGLMTKRLERNNFRPQNAEELWNGIQVCWESIPADYIQNLIASMPRRLDSVLEGTGNTTKY